MININKHLKIQQYDRSSTHDFRLSLAADLEMTTVCSQTNINDGKIGFFGKKKMII